MKRVVALVALLFLTLPVRAEEVEPPRMSLAGYAKALHTADLLLAAWVQRDADLGLSLLSPRLRRASQPDSAEVAVCLRQYFAGLSNPQHGSFEIGAGSPLSAGRYSFPVILFECYTGEYSAERSEDSLEVQLVDGIWRVDRLPRSLCDQ